MASENWLTTTLTSIRDLLIIAATVVGIVWVIRFLTRGKWPKIEQDGPVVASPVDAPDLPTGAELEKWLVEQSKRAMKMWSIMVVASSLLLTTLPIQAQAVTNLTNGSIAGMYEYRQILDGKSVDSVTNIFHISEGMYKLYFEMRVKIYGQSQPRVIQRIIPIKLSDPVSDYTWLYVAGGFIFGGVLGYAIAK